MRQSDTPINDAIDRDIVLCQKALQEGSFGETLQGLDNNRLHHLRKIFHIAVSRSGMLDSNEKQSIADSVGKELTDTIDNL